MLRSHTEASAPIVSFAPWSQYVESWQGKAACVQYRCSPGVSFDLWLVLSVDIDPVKTGLTAFLQSLTCSQENQKFSLCTFSQRNSSWYQCHGAVLNWCVPVLFTARTPSQGNLSTTWDGRRACYSAVGCIRICVWRKATPDFSGGFWKWLWVLSGVLHLQQTWEAPFLYQFFPLPSVPSCSTFPSLQASSCFWEAFLMTESLKGFFFPYYFF